MSQVDEEVSETPGPSHRVLKSAKEVSLLEVFEIEDVLGT